MGVARLRQGQAPAMELVGLASVFLLKPHRGETMDKERVKGMADQAKGSVKETAGKITGDEKLKTEGQMDRAEGKVRNAVGGMKDEVRDATRNSRH
jgi:uncharacterized protein YjbJ (UPF0337 family)